MDTQKKTWKYNTLIVRKTLPSGEVKVSKFSIEDELHALSILRHPSMALALGQGRIEIDYANENVGG